MQSSIKFRLLSFLSISSLALAITGCAAPIPKEAHVVCTTEHGLTFSSRYDRDELKCVTDKRDEGSILETGLSRGGRERFWFRVFVRNKANPNERIADVTPESFTKYVEDGYARDGDVTYSYRLDSEEISTVELTGTQATHRKRRIVVNGYDRTLHYLFFENGAFEYVAVLTPHWYEVTDAKTDTMLQEVVHGLSIQ